MFKESDPYRALPEALIAGSESGVARMVWDASKGPESPMLVVVME